MSKFEKPPRAFPHPPLINAHGLAITHGDFGMTLRDYFAAKALQGLASSGCLTFVSDAASAYAAADAMLAERSKP